MKKFTCVAVVLFAFACSKKDANEKQPDPSAKVVAKQDPKDLPAEAVATKTIPVTTKSPEAKAAFERGENLAVVARRNEAAPEFKKAIELDPDFAQAHALLGAVTRGSEGMVHLEKAMMLAGKLPEAERTYIDAWRLLLAGDQAGTIAAFTKVTELAPDDFKPYVQLGNIYNQNGDSATGLKMFQKLAQLKPDLALVQNGLAYAHAGLREWDAAIAAAKKQTELLPKEPNPQDTLGEILMFAGKFDEGEKAFQQAVTIEPKFTGAWQGVALNRAYRGDWKGAAEATEKLRAPTEDRNARIDATIEMAWYAAAAGKQADAYALLDGLDKDPENAKEPIYAAVASDRGMLLQLAGKYDDSLKAFADAVKRTEGMPVGAKKFAARDQAIGVLRAAAMTGKASADADKLVAVTAEDATTPIRQSYNAWAKGLATWAKSGPKDAVAELSKCSLELLGCRYDLAAAQRKAGDAKAAEATDKQIVETPVRSAIGVYFYTLANKKK